MLRVLFGAPFGADLVFKGGTSLAKAYDAIRRFSEDIDVTYDIRAFAPDLVTGAGAEALPSTRSQEQRWSRAIRSRLAEWVRGEALAAVGKGFRRPGLSGEVSASGERLVLRYEPLLEAYGFVRPEVIVEFGARGTGEPHETRPGRVRRGAASSRHRLSDGLSVGHDGRTHFLGKGDRDARVLPPAASAGRSAVSRHWHDVVRLDETGYAGKALVDRSLALSVARHKAAFFREKDAGGRWIDYRAAVSGGMQLVPEGFARDALRQDYERMVSGGMLDDAEPFDVLLDGCADLEARANNV